MYVDFSIHNHNAKTLECVILRNQLKNNRSIQFTGGIKHLEEKFTEQMGDNSTASGGTGELGDNFMSSFSLLGLLTYIYSWQTKETTIRRVKCPPVLSAQHAFFPFPLYPSFFLFVLSFPFPSSFFLFSF